MHVHLHLRGAHGDARSSRSQEPRSTNSASGSGSDQSQVFDTGPGIYQLKVSAGLDDDAVVGQDRRLVLICGEGPRPPKSLVWATDIDTLPPDRVVERHGDHFAVRSPGTRSTGGETCLLFDDAPAPGDGIRWEQRSPPPSHRNRGSRIGRSRGIASTVSLAPRTPSSSSAVIRSSGPLDLSGHRRADRRPPTGQPRGGDPERSIRDADSEPVMRHQVPGDRGPTSTTPT